jgi:hypothetical protein
MAMNGDYYEWFCDWCDSRNFTRVYQAAEGAFSCCACHRKTGYGFNSRQLKLSPVFSGMELSEADKGHR